MELIFEGYKVRTDERQFIVQKKKIIQDGKFTKAENIGKEVWQDIRYYSTLNPALKFLAKSILLDNDDLTVIKEKLDNLESKIDQFTRMITK